LWTLLYFDSKQQHHTLNNMYLYYISIFTMFNNQILIQQKYYREKRPSSWPYSKKVVISAFLNSITSISIYKYIDVQKISFNFIANHFVNLWFCLFGVVDDWNKFQSSTHPLVISLWNWLKWLTIKLKEIYSTWMYLYIEVID